MSIVPTNLNNYLRQFAHQLEERVLHDFRDHHLADKTGSPHHNSLGYPLFFT